jgi:hypothetical protein
VENCGRDEAAAVSPGVLCLNCFRDCLVRLDEAATWMCSACGTRVGRPPSLSGARRAPGLDQRRTRPRFVKAVAKRRAKRCLYESTNATEPLIWGGWTPSNHPYRKPGEIAKLTRRSLGLQNPYKRWSTANAHEHLTTEERDVSQEQSP